MGIRGLHQFLQPYGKRLVFDHCEDKLESRPPIVIDGPALAFHLWREEKLQEGEYRRYKKALLKYLKTLQKCFAIAAIYFDGHLPPHKRDIRLARAVASAERVRRNTGSLEHSTPGPAFVVMLTQDLLRQEGYLVQVTLEEADSATARTVQQLIKAHMRDCYMLSMDSDMHCFDLGPYGFYLPLDSLLLSEDSLSADAYNYAATKSTLGVDLVDLACVMGAEGGPDLSVSGSEALRSLKNGFVADRAEMKRVRALFSMKTNSSTSLSHTQVAELMHTGKLYGRLSEMLQDGEMWLPQLLEDISQSSAWSSSTAFRQEAYSLLMEKAASRAMDHVMERLRLSEAISAKSVSLSDSTMYHEKDLPRTKQDFFIKCVHVLLDAQCKAGDPLTSYEVQALIVMFLGTYARRKTETSSRMLHVMANWQAIVFSLTMLLQAADAPYIPLVSDMYDLQTFLIALDFLRSGHDLKKLASDHAEEAGQLLSDIGEISSVRRGRKSRSISNV